MNRITLAVAAVLLTSVGGLTLQAASKPAAPPAPAVSSYDPFKMLRAIVPKIGTKEYQELQKRAEIIKKCKDKVKPPKDCKPRSPHKPGDDDDDDDGDDDDDDHGNGHGHHDDDHDDDHHGNNGNNGKGNGRGR
jgi:hypothetical protein